MSLLINPYQVAIARLIAEGTRGEVLFSKGGSVTPSFVGMYGGELLDNGILSGASVSWTSSLIDTSLFGMFRLVVRGVVPVTDSAFFHLRVSVSGGVRSTAGDYGYSNAFGQSDAGHGEASGISGQTEMVVGTQLGGQGMGNGTYESLNAEIVLASPALAGGGMLFWHGSQTLAHNHFGAWTGGGYYKGSADAIDGLLVKPSAGNWAGGDYWLYGMRLDP